MRFLMFLHKLSTKTVKQDIKNGWEEWSIVKMKYHPANILLKLCLPVYRYFYL